ncbi:MAG TPA: efflux RND transporter permease subunit, partial [Thermomicrobiales bacterium]|nr:efflux RND transporter permease subunit [Thermomicrobiales bacterium]
QELRSTPGVLDVGAHVGRALMSDQSIDVNGGEIWVALDPKADYDATVDAVRAVVGGYPGIRSDVLTYPTERERALLGQGSDTVVARLYGQDFDILTAKAGEIQQRMAKIDGIVEPHIIAPYQQEPTLQVEVDLAKAQQYGVSPGEVRRAAAALLSGVSVGNLFDDQKVFEVVVRGAPGIRVSPSGVRELLIDTPDGGHVRLGDVATVALAPMPADIRHDSVLRYVDIGAGLRGRDIGAVTTDLTASLATMDMPLEYHAEVLGGFAQRQGMERQLLAMSIAALVGMFLLLQAAFNSWKLAGLAFLALPGAVAGGVVAIALGGGVLSLGALAGLLAIFAIAARDVVFQIRRLQCGDAERGQTLDPVRALAAAADGLAPTLATALATGLALTPLALLGPVAGNELTRPLALAAFGGLVTATLVNLLVVPTLYPSLAPTPEPATALEPPALGPAIGPALQ